MNIADIPPVVFGAMAHFCSGDDDARVAVMQDAVEAGFRAFRYGTALRIRSL